MQSHRWPIVRLSRRGAGLTAVFSGCPARHSQITAGTRSGFAAPLRQAIGCEPPEPRVSRGAGPSHPAGGDVAIDLPLDTDEDDAVPGRVSLVPFHLVVGHGDFRPVRYIALAVRDDRDVAAAADLEDVGFVGVGLAAARASGGVGVSRA